MAKEPKLTFELVMKRISATGSVESEEYVIPESAKAEVLDALYPFEGVPSLDDERFDLHAERMFQVRDFKVVREAGVNYLVSPYYYDGGGTVIDWMPPEFEGER